MWSESKAAKSRIMVHPPMILSFHPCYETDAQIILGDRRPGPHELALIQKAEAIILPQGCSQDLYEACLESRAPIFPNYSLRFKYPGKRRQRLLFQDFGCAFPRTLSWSTVREFEEACETAGLLPHELPFLIKEDKGHEAEGVYLVTDDRSHFIPEEIKVG